PPAARLPRRREGPMRCRSLLPLLGLILGHPAVPRAAAADPKPEPAQLEFFEKKVRPVLAEHCQSCHGPDKQKGGLRLDSRADVLKGGDSGPAVEPGEPDKSRLVRAVRYAGDLHMPPKTKLPAEQAEALAAWVKMGAPWPEAAAESRAAASTFTITAKDREFWSFRPVRRPAVPEVRTPNFTVRNPIDAFVAAKWAEK